MRKPHQFEKRECTISNLILASFLWTSANARADNSTAFKPYGFIHANISAASGALVSFGSENQSAPTVVAPSNIIYSSRARSTFQVAQSRLGFFVEKDLLKGQLEFDFIDFTRAAPNQNANPRLRIANIDYHIDSRQTLSLGQTWDIFSSPQKPFTYNIVGLYFEAGNVGFMRPQFRYSYQTDTQWTFGFAIGLPARNLNATDGEVEKSLLPTLSATAIHHATQGLQWGGSMIAAEIRAAAFPTPLSQVYGVNTFVSTESESGFKTRSSIYVGRNLASIGALSLAWATGGNHDEVGGYCTFSNPLSETLSVQGGLGGATILQAEGSTLDSIAGVRVNSNLKTELAFAYHPQKDADIYIQTTFMNTHYTKTNGDADSKVAMALQIGSVYRF